MNRVKKVALIGAAGRMGTEIVRAAAGADNLRIQAAVEHQGSPAVGQDLGRLAGIGETGLLITADLDPALVDVDVIIELSLPAATAKVIAAAVRRGLPLVSGTTGLGEQTLAAINDAAARIPILYTANLSPGIAVLSELVGRAAAALGPDYDIEIVEKHHRNKVDAPSGTALALAHAAARACPERQLRFQQGRSGHTGVRPFDEIGLHAVRGGGVFGEHAVILAGSHERLELSHMAGSRTLFAAGALRAARYLVGKPPGRYTMADVLSLHTSPA